MSTVIPRPNESIDSLLRRFKKAVDKSGLLADLKKHEFYEKPSVRRKRKSAVARKRAMKRQRKAEQTARPSNQNFKWNKDRTEKIHTAPKPNAGGSKYQSHKDSNNRSDKRPSNFKKRNDRPNNNFRKPNTNRPTSSQAPRPTTQPAKTTTVSAPPATTVQVVTQSIQSKPGK